MSDSFDPKDFWAAQGLRAIGSALVTAEGASGPAGFVALSATHLTAQPPIMTVAVMPTTSALEAIRASGAFAINYLSTEARDVLGRFMGRDAPKGAVRFEGLDCTRLVTGAPVLPGIVGALDCRLEDETERFGTVLIFGRIVAMTRSEGARPLVHFGGGYLGA